MITLTNMSKYYATKQGRHFVFKNVNIDIPTNNNVAILGPNGVGKSTLIRMIGGSDYPNKGQISSNKNISWPLGLQGGLQGSMTARENVRFVARIHGHRHTKAIEQQVEEFAEIGAFFDEPIKSCSSGMRARVSFGLTMVFEFNFDVLLVDELSAVGDANFRKKSEALLLERYKSTVLFMVSHSMTELQKHCQSGLLIKDQQLTFYPDLQHAITDYEKTYVIN